MGRFDGLVVWITGGGSGIGRALAREFARQGADVAVSGRRTDRLQETIAEIEALGRRGLAVACDVRDDAAARAAVGAIAEHFGRLDVAVANAGMGVMGRFEQLTDAEWRRQFDVNVFGAVNTARHALPELHKTAGRLALVGSVAAMMCAPRAVAYSASKFALRAIGLTLSQELHGSGVTCTTIHPGFVASEIAQVDNQGRFEARRKDRRPRLLLWPTDRAARRMVRAIDQRRREYVFTAHGKTGAWLGRHLPGLMHFIMTRAGGQSTTAMAEKKGS
jgi:NAD(P)-dependent dehydrogenase (short-subunit alcohol dehydrogenase family)